uniref:lysM and putative peptidoglycan-binding domain-containing protein 2-like n=1 Tax=Callithrix jacchus TaxID=9483 RepID=UPI0023DD1194|nr:lysM and putative peptidoglycan-binding domain-containing protein 2-like [Callithrix jacchus]
MGWGTGALLTTVCASVPVVVLAVGRGSSIGLCASTHIYINVECKWANAFSYKAQSGKLYKEYNITTEHIKRASKLCTNDGIFKKKTLNIHVILEKLLLLNGLNSIDSPENETVGNSFSQEEEPVVAPQESDVQPVQPEEVSGRDFLQRLNLWIKLSTQATKKLKEKSRDEKSPYATSLYNSLVIWGHNSHQN